MSRPTGPSLPLGERLVAAGHLSRTQLDVALREQRRTGALLGKVVVGLGFVSEEVVEAALADEAGSRRVRLEFITLQPEAIALVPEAIARHHHLIPIAVQDGVLQVAMSDTFDVVAVDAVERVCHQRVEVVGASRQEIDQAIDRSYQRHTASLEQITDEVLAHLDHDADAVERGQDTPLIRLVDQLLRDAIDERATDIHIEPEERVVRVRLRLDGMLSQTAVLPARLARAVAARIKILADLNIAETRAPQDGRIGIKVGEREVDLRVSTLPTIHGENVVIRILDQSGVVLSMEELGFSPGHLALFHGLIKRPNGVLLVTGPTGSGKSTTLYTALSALNSMERSIFTLEDPVEYRLPIIRQTQMNPAAGMTFATGLRALLRQDPDVILVGEMRDHETAELGVRAALTGHLVFSSLHTNNAAGALPRMIDMGIAPYLVASSVNAVIAQRLVRKVCNRCTTPVLYTDEELNRLGMGEAAGLPFFRGSGCAACHQSGYRGRAAIFEILVVDDAIREMVHKQASSAEIQATAVAGGMALCRQDGIQKAMVGVTTLEEVARVT
ncbi:MAG: Flp pilus assembly complex ATPase component [Deltaproteobacteria bacterium]|nr:Flp pilus assembly complex ATPase component [Deltaproteobacteria bacterium]NCP95099.1 Flp pilus assembly complex ATPase component [Deltaproteobacteria bacterium]NCS74268.1 Flp pilus assembly complex ATPase component [Deltaproteobacteria bacterium]